MAIKTQIAPCLWFDTQAEDAAKFYVAIFADSGIDAISRDGKEGFEFHGQPEGSVMTVAFRLAGQAFTALNGGPQFKFTEAVSFQIFCDTQDEIDHLWNKLSAGGEEVQALGEKLLVAGPDQLSGAERMRVMADQRVMVWLHQQMWQRPGGSLASWWRGAILEFSRRD